MRPPTDRRPRLVALSLVAIALGAWSDGPGAVPSDPIYTATRADGSTVAGHLRGLNPRGDVVLAVDDKGPGVTVLGSDLVRVAREGSAAPTPAEGSIVLFPDGDRLNRVVIGPAGETSIEVQSFSMGTVAVPLDGVLGLILVPPVDPDAVHQLSAKVRDEPRAGEVLWLSNGDRLAGGLLGIDDKKVAFQSAGGKADLDRSSVVAVGFDPKTVAYPKPPGAYLEIGLLDGSRLGVVGARLESGHLLATTRTGAAIRVPIGELAAMTTRNGPALYLSDRPPTLEKYVSYLGPTRPVRADLAVDGQALRLGGRTFDRGLGTQSRSYLVYALEPGLKRFQALVGVDDRAGPLGSVVFRVVVNGKEAFATPPMSVRETPRPIDLDIRGAKTLVLITDFGDRGEVRDHADWADARLIR